MNILDLLKEQPQMMQQTAPQQQQQPVPTEKAQIVVASKYSYPSIILRFNSVKKAEKEYKALRNAWHKQLENPMDVEGTHFVEADMFHSDLLLSSISALSLVNHSVLAKFVPV